MSLESLTSNTSNRPKATKFSQQTLKGWQPIITTKNLYVPFIILGVLFLCIGAVLTYFTSTIQHIEIDYTNCKSNNGSDCSVEILAKNLTSKYESCECNINVTLVEQFKGQVYVYYRLTKFFQNHRRYLRSRDEKQLQGQYVENLSDVCEPYQYFNDSSKVMYAPCGLVANSIFNDTFKLSLQKAGNLIDVSWTKKGISWKSERELRFGKPKSWENTIKPPNWPIPAYMRSPDAYSGDEELLVWMRTAALPDFKKLHRIVNHDKHTLFAQGLPKGQYLLTINYSYPVVQYGGKKYFYITTTNGLGGKNWTLGALILLMGIIYVSLGVTFVFINTFVAKRVLKVDVANNGLLDDYSMRHGLLTPAKLTTRMSEETLRLRLQNTNSIIVPLKIVCVGKYQNKLMKPSTKVTETKELERISTETDSMKISTIQPSSTLTEAITGNQKQIESLNQEATGI